MSETAERWWELELAAIWDERIRLAIRRRAANPQLSWTAIADSYGIGVSTLRVYRERFWKKQAASASDL